MSEVAATSEVSSSVVTTVVEVSNSVLAEYNQVSKPVVKNVKKRQSDQPKPSMHTKRLWHAYVAGKKGPKLSLKKFAATLTSDPVVEEWRQNKNGKLERKAKAARIELKGGKLREIAQASKSARKGS